MWFISLAWMFAVGPAAAEPAPAPVPVSETPVSRGPESTPDTLRYRMRLVSDLAETGDGRGEVLEPAGLAVDAFGRVYVSDATLNRMQRFDRDGRWLGEAGALGSDPGQMRRPGAMALLGAGAVAVLDVENRRVLSYDLLGQSLGIVIDLAAPGLEGQVGRIDALALAADRGGAIYIVDADRDRLLAFDATGRFLRTVGGFGARPGSFRGLQGIGVAARGQLVTAERVNARVQRLDSGGRPLATWSLPTRQGRGILAVAVDDSGRVAVSDESGDALWLYDAGGRLLAALSGMGGPRALAFTPAGDLLVAETRPARVRRYAIERGSGSKAASGE